MGPSKGGNCAGAPSVATWARRGTRRSPRLGTSGAVPCPHDAWASQAAHASLFVTTFGSLSSFLWGILGVLLQFPFTSA